MRSYDRTLFRTYRTLSLTPTTGSKSSTLALHPTSRVTVANGSRSSMGRHILLVRKLQRDNRIVVQKRKCGTLETCGNFIDDLSCDGLCYRSLGVLLFTIIFGENPFQDREEIMKGVFKYPFGIDSCEFCFCHAMSGLGFANIGFRSSPISMCKHYRKNAYLR